MSRTMAAFIQFILLVLWASNSNAQPETSPNDTREVYNILFQNYGYPKAGDIPILNRKIFRGYRVTIREHPYVVSIRRKYSHYMPGALIGKNLVISVAHPVFKVSVGELGVVVGENYSDRGSCLHIILFVIIHQDFDSNTLAGDLALFRLYRDIRFRSYVKSIPLLSPDFSLTENQAFVSGWGRCDYTDRDLCLPRSSTFFHDEKIDPMLRTISFTITTPNIYCEGYNRHKTQLSPGMLCTGTAREEDAVTPCLAVPGAPLVVEGSLAGLQSWGFGCGYRNDLPLVYTSIQNYHSWISNNVDILRGITMDNLTGLFKATKSYLLFKWLNKTRIGTLTTPKYSRLVFKELDIDEKLTELEGNVYDIRDFMADGRYQRLKLNLYGDIKNKKLRIEKYNITMDTQRKLMPFLSYKTLSDGFEDDIE